MAEKTPEQIEQARLTRAEQDKQTYIAQTERYLARLEEGWVAEGLRVHDGTKENGDVILLTGNEPQALTRFLIGLMKAVSSTPSLIRRRMVVILPLRAPVTGTPTITSGGGRTRRPAPRIRCSTHTTCRASPIATQRRSR